MRTPTATVLVVEDDPGDQELLRRAFAQSDSRLALRFTNDGDEALGYLRQTRGDCADEFPRPRFILLDLNMPRLDGLGFLRAVATDSDFAAIPALIFTTSTNEGEIREAYRLGCKSYIPKPVDLSGLVAVARLVTEYWCRLSLTPNSVH